MFCIPRETLQLLTKLLNLLVKLLRSLKYFLFTYKSFAFPEKPWICSLNVCVPPTNFGYKFCAPREFCTDSQKFCIPLHLQKVCIRPQNFCISMRNFVYACKSFVSLQETLLARKTFAFTHKSCVCQEPLMHTWTPFKKNGIIISEIGLLFL